MDLETTFKPFGLNGWLKVSYLLDYILIWGDAGVGKTTFCQKLCQDWALSVTGRPGTDLDKLSQDQKNRLLKTGILVYIMLRDTNSDNALEQIFEKPILRKLRKFGSSKVDSASIMFSYLATLDTKVTLVCDGFDEISYEQGEIIDIIKGNLYKNLRCITTCRPHASHEIIFHVDFEIKLKGFSAKQAKLFLEIYART